MGPDFYLTLNPDGTAQVIQTVTTPYGNGGQGQVVAVTGSGRLTIQPQKERC